MPLEEPFDPRSLGGRALGHLDFYDPDNQVMIIAVEVPTAQPARAWSYIPAVVLFGLVRYVQTSRRRRQETAPAKAGPGERTHA